MHQYLTLLGQWILLSVCLHTFPSVHHMCLLEWIVAFRSFKVSVVNVGKSQCSDVPMSGAEGSSQEGSQQP